MAKDELPENERRQGGDDALVMRARSDSNAFILLYDIYYEKIVRFCFMNVHVRQATEDITSIVFTQAAQDILKFKGKTRRQFVQWVCDMASGQIKIYLKKNASEGREEQEIEIDAKHKERLRTKLLAAYEQGQAKKSKMILYLPIAAAMILIGIFIMISSSSKTSTVSPEKPKLKTIIEPQKLARIIERKAVEQQKPEIEEEEQETEIVMEEPNETITAQSQKADGIIVRGRVLDWQQNPVQATVTKGPFPKGQEARVLCDANGNFEFSIAESGIEVFTAQCEGAAPAVLPVEIKSDMEPITIALSPPNVISGQVVDVNGSPVEGAALNVSFWRGVGSIVFSTKTDAQGYFQWDSAPDDEVHFNIQRNNFMSLRDYPMQKGIDYKILLLRPAKMFGQIICSEPTAQVESFIMTIGYYFEKDKITWQDANSVIFSGNKYEMNITEPFEFKLKIQAEGFKTIESAVFNPPQGAFDYNFIIHRED